MGLLITIEGGEFVGKSAVGVPGLEWVLREAGYDVRSSREPGGSPEAEAIRNEIFAKAEQKTTPDELALLFNKARRIHLEQVIKPFLGKHKEKDGIMILDRYLDSTRVYQGLEGRLPMERIYELEAEFVDDYLPDITFILYFPPDHFNALLKARQQLVETSRNDHRSITTWDEMDADKQRTRQEYYFRIEELAKKRNEKRYFYPIDASRSPLEVVGGMITKVKPLLPDSSHHDISGAFKKLEDAPVLMFQQRQWKKQQQLLRGI